MTASSSVPSPRPRGDDGDGVVPQPRVARDDERPADDEATPVDEAGPVDDVAARADEVVTPVEGGRPADEQRTAAPPAAPAPIVRPDVPRQSPAPALSGALLVVRPPARSVDAPAVGRPVPTQRVYADGSALSRYLEGAPCRAQWLAWTADHEAELLTTPLGLTELRRVARPRGVEASGVAHDVEERVEVIRFSDQTLRAATKVSGVLPPFIALHIGAALAHPDVASVATYDVQLAQVSALHGLTVVSPGWPAQWWERAV